MTLAALDWAIIVVCLVGCMIAGIWMRRYSSHVDDFTVAGREVVVNPGIASLASPEMGLVTIRYTAQLGFEKGFAGASHPVFLQAAGRRPDSQPEPLHCEVCARESF